jgi:hypothetical protein
MTWQERSHRRDFMRSEGAKSAPIVFPIKRRP